MTVFKYLYSTPSEMADSIARNGAACRKSYYDFIDLFCRYMGDGGNREAADKMLERISSEYTKIAKSVYKERKRSLLFWLLTKERGIVNYKRVTCTVDVLATYIKKMEGEIRVDILNCLRPIIVSWVDTVYPSGYAESADAACLMVLCKIKHDNPQTLSREIGNLAKELQQKCDEKTSVRQKSRRKAFAY